MSDTTKIRRPSSAPLRTFTALLVIAFAFAASPSAAQTGPATDLADWVTVDDAANVATGTLRGASVSLTGTDVGPGSVTDETFTGFATANFSPPVPETDAVGVVVTSGSSFTLTFGAPLKDPVLHLASFGSTFEFPAGTVISKVSGEPGLTVSGSSVMGAEGPGVGQAADANGTVQLIGTFSSLPFTANPIPGAPNGDGLYLQVGARVPATPLLPPPSPPLPLPDFSLAIGPSGPSAESALVIAPGDRATLPVSVLRNISSNGRVGLSVTGLPAGVTASFEPTEVGGRADASTLTLTAAPNAVPTFRSITISGAPLDPSAGTASQSLPFSMVVQGSLAARVEGIEVTQAVQTNNQPRLTTYDGVALVKHKKTVVRVFADFVGRGVLGAARPALGMALFVSDANGRPKPGSPLFPEWTPESSSLSLNDVRLTPEERNRPGAFTFVLPDAWTRGPIKLEARALGSSGDASARANALCVATACGATPARLLTGVTFRDPPRASAISALQQFVVYHALIDPTKPEMGPDPAGAVTGIGTYSTTAAQAFAKLQALSPVPFHFYDSQDRESDWPRYRATRFASDTAILEPAAEFDRDIGSPGLGTVGLFVLGDNPGVTVDRTSVVSVRTNSPGVLWRPVTSVAHEVFHLLGFKHASTSCGALDGEPWPVANGRMDSVGLDPTPRSGGPGAGSAPYRIIADTNASPAYDLMSYCGITSGDAPHWISARNWNRALGLAPPVTVKHLGRAKVLTLRARLLRGEVKFVSIAPSTGLAALETVPSKYRIAARDGSGRLLSTTAVSQQLASGAAGVEPFTVLEANVPSAGVARVEIVAGDTVVAARSRSAGQPRARFLAPTGGRRVGRARTVPVRWRVTDADGDPVQVKLDYSRNGGRTYTNVWTGPDTGSAQVPTEYLDATKNARLRLRANDGFNETSTLSARFELVPRRPRVEILEPRPGQPVDAGGAIFLRGAAVDDRGRAIVGGRLRWLAGRQVVGRGASVSAVLPAGTRRLSLQAVGAAGAVASATVAVRVRSTTPFLVRVISPPILSRRARSLTLVVSATQRSTLRVGKRRFVVGPQSRRVRIPVAPGKRTLSLQLTLTAGGKSSRRTVVVTR